MEKNLGLDYKFEGFEVFLQNAKISQNSMIEITNNVLLYDKIIIILQILHGNINMFKNAY